MHDDPMKNDIQELIPESHRHLIEAVPRGAAASAVNGGLLLGTFGGALIANWIPAQIVAVVPALLFVLHRIWIWKSDRRFETQLETLRAQGLTWGDQGNP